MNARLESVLACPRCGAALRLERSGIQCSECATTFRTQDDVPVFIDGDIAVAREHASNPIGAEFEALLRAGHDFVLNIGAGGTATRYPNCIEFEHKIFRHTDLVGDAHHLPFRDAVFDRVFAFNVFEHLREPKLAAAEILRVLKPGGTVAIHTAFLQALHEPPHHFFNATEFGVREWFSGFEIERCAVSGNFGPGVMLAFLLSNVIEAVRAGGGSWKDVSSFENSGIGEWADFWAKKGGPPPAFDALQNLPQEFQKRVSAGFELVGIKPAS
ncbi:MAG: methyltransferase domain-containing protein [Verrucomicrobiota bacterium]|nr:methyltransferase domain-containing protein [Verrucomicrobiota bacterium]